MSLLAGAIAIGAAPQTEPPAPNSTQQHAPADDRLARELLAVIGSGDEARARAFHASAFSSKAAAFEPPATTLTRLLALTRDAGGLEVTDWHPEGDRIFFEGRTGRGAIPVQGMVGLDGGKLAGFELMRNPAGRLPGAPAWPPSATDPASVVRAIGAEVDWRAANGLFSGAVLVAHRGEPVFERAWGLATRAPDVTASATTRFGTASTTKMLTSAAVGLLIDRGKLSLDMPVARAVPAMASAPGAATVTIRDLLGHRTSYGDIFDDNGRSLLPAGAGTAEQLRLIAGRTPEPAPPGRIAYSNANFLLLAAAVETASGRSFHDFVEAGILRPLGMSRTGYGRDGKYPADLARGWIRDEVSDPLGIGALQPAPRGDKPDASAAGGAWSTVGDMWRLVDGLAAGRLLKPATLQAMWGDRVSMGRMGSALGFMFRGKDEPRFFGHSGGGGNMGVSTAAYVTPDREWAVVVLSNFSSPAGEILAGQIMDYLGGLPVAPVSGQTGAK